MQPPSPIQDILSRRVESNVVVGITAFTKPIALETKNRTKLPRHVRGRTTLIVERGITQAGLLIDWLRLEIPRGTLSGERNLRGCGFPKALRCEAQKWAYGMLRNRSVKVE